MALKMATGLGKTVVMAVKEICGVAKGSRLLAEEIRLRAYRVALQQGSRCASKADSETKMAGVGA